MGSPLLLVIANLFMEYIEERALNTTITKLWIGYVDNTFVIWLHGSTIALFLGHSQILSCSHGETSGEGLGSLPCHEPEMVDSVQTESTLRTNQVHHFQSVLWQ